MDVGGASGRGGEREASKVMATLYSAKRDGDRIVEGETQVSPANGRCFSLRELQAMVGGYIEALYLGDGRTFFVNEDGKRLGLPLNRKVNLMLAERGRLRPGDSVVGNAVLCDRDEVK